MSDTKHEPNTKAVPHRGKTEWIEELESLQLTLVFDVGYEWHPAQTDTIDHENGSTPGHDSHSDVFNVRLKELAIGKRRFISGDIIASVQADLRVVLEQAAYDAMQKPTHRIYTKIDKEEGLW